MKNVHNHNLAQHQVVAYFGSKCALDIVWLSDWLQVHNRAVLYADPRLSRHTSIVSNRAGGIMFRENHA